MTITGKDIKNIFLKKSKKMKFANVSPYQLIPEGSYPVTILSFEEVTNTYYKEGEPEHRKTRLTWNFEMPDGVSIIKYFTGKNLGSTKANLVKLVAAVLGKSPKQLTDKDKEIDTEKIIGKKVMIKVVHIEDEEEEGQMWHRIQSVKPISKKKDKTPF